MGCKLSLVFFLVQRRDAGEWDDSAGRLLNVVGCWGALFKSFGACFFEVLQAVQGEAVGLWGSIYLTIPHIMLQ